MLKFEGLQMSKQHAQTFAQSSIKLLIYKYEQTEGHGTHTTSFVNYFEYFWTLMAIEAKLLP